MIFLVQARKRMMNLLKEVVLKKRASGEEFGEFFKIIFGENERGKEKMSVENAINYIYTFFLIANETTPRILAATVKLISEKPRVMQELQREHARIVGDRSEKDAALTWEDYKSMTFTHMVSTCKNHVYTNDTAQIIYTEYLPFCFIMY